MIALIVISGILVYAFVAIVVYHVWVTVAEKRCGECDRWYSSCDHVFTAFPVALVWPAALPLIGVGYIIYQVGKTVSEKIAAIVEAKVK